tara:strand:- start:1223 stop:1348 length:126 start_codon:yes stop_codon:yes gene_type:complete
MDNFLKNISKPLTQDDIKRFTEAIKHTKPIATFQLPDVKKK